MVLSFRILKHDRLKQRLGASFWFKNTERGAGKDFTESV